MKTKCPSCNAHLPIEMYHVGKSVTCECGHEFICEPYEHAKKNEKSKDLARVVITDIDIPFAELVGFLVKLAIAAIPASIIIAIVYGILFLLFNMVIFGFISSYLKS